MGKLLGRLIGVIFIIPLFQISAEAQQRRDIFASPKNLKVLPDDISSAELRAIMRGFATSLGVRCTHCHEGDANTNIMEVDFSADVKEEKEVARQMMKMLRSINETVSSIDRAEGHMAPDVACVTCHRGQSQPFLIQDILSAKLETDGVEAAIAEYRSLRQRFFGSHTYDLSATTLSRFADEVLGRGQAAEALALHDLNIEFNPGDARVLLAKSGAQRRTGDLEGALATARQADEAAPNVPFIQRTIQQLEAAIAENAEQ